MIQYISRAIRNLSFSNIFCCNHKPSNQEVRLVVYTDDVQNEKPYVLSSKDSVTLKCEPISHIKEKNDGIRLKGNVKNLREVQNVDLCDEMDEREIKGPLPFSTEILRKLKSLAYQIKIKNVKQNETKSLVKISNKKKGLNSKERSIVKFSKNIVQKPIHEYSQNIKRCTVNRSALETSDNDIKIDCNFKNGDTIDDDIIDIDGTKGEIFEIKEY